MGGAMLSKSLIQFSVDGRVWPSLLFDLGPNFGGGNEDNGDLLQKEALSAPNPEAGHPTPLPETPEHSSTSLGQSPVGSLLLSPGSWCIQNFICALKESVSPVLCKFWQLYDGVNGDLLQEVLCLTHVCWTQSPVPVVVQGWPGDAQTQFWLSLCGVCGSWCAQGLFEPSEHLWWVWGLILKAISPLLLSYQGFSFALGWGYLLKVTPVLHSLIKAMVFQWSCMDVRVGL